MSRAGRKSFNSCDVKVVEFKDFVYVDDSRERKVLSSDPSEDTRIFAGNSAVLHCPRTEDDRVNIHSQYTSHPDKTTALASVRKLAGELLCRDCKYAAMTPVEVSIERKEIAAAEADRLEAYAALERAQNEVAEINAKHRSSSQAD